MARTLRVNRTNREQESNDRLRSERKLGMRMNVKTLTRSALALTLLVPIAACDQGPSPEVQARIDSLQTARDSLAREMAQQNETIQQLTTSIERAVAEVSETGVTAPENLPDRIETMAENLRSARSQLEESQRRIRSLSSRSSQLRDSINAVIASRDAALATHRDSIDALMAELETMSGRVDSLSTERSVLAETLSEVEEKYYTVYVAIGTRDELVEQGVIEAEGGARVLLILWKAGETLVQARDLNREAFQAIDMREMTTIDLPQQGQYRVVSRHSLDHLQPVPDENAVFAGESLEITDPERFWQASQYLILVRID